LKNFGFDQCQTFKNDSPSTLKLCRKNERRKHQQVESNEENDKTISKQLSEEFALNGKGDMNFENRFDIKYKSDKGMLKSSLVDEMAEIFCSAKFSKEDSANYSDLSFTSLEEKTGKLKWHPLRARKRRRTMKF